MAVAAVPGSGAGGQRPRRLWRYWLRQSVWAAVDLVFPPQCAGCGRPGQRFCQDCRAQLETLNAPLCDRCGYPVETPGPCQACRSGANVINSLIAIRSAFFHAGPLRLAIHQLKYKRDGILADTMAAWMVAAAPPPATADWLVVPVPLAPRRLAERGYNQAALLARAYAELSGPRLAMHAALRIRETDSQIGLPPAQRRRNVAGAFEAERSLVNGQAIVLIDDVCTTGATLDACGAALLEAGATQVWGLSLARAKLREPIGKETRIPAGTARRNAGAVP